MFMEERKQEILNILKEKGNSVTVKELCRTLYASGATIRRDLKDLELKNLIRRTHGGAILTDESVNEDPLAFREMHAYIEKQKIAQMATQHISDGMTLFLDSSTTVYTLALELKNFNNIKVITNGLKTAVSLSEFRGVKVYCTGGFLKDNHKSLVGVSALDFISRYHADVSFLSCRGFKRDIGATDSSEEEYYIKNKFIENSNKAILLFDTSKMNQSFMCKLGSPQTFNYIITENGGLNLELNKLTNQQTT